MDNHLLKASDVSFETHQTQRPGKVTEAIIIPLPDHELVWDRIPHSSHPPFGTTTHPAGLRLELAMISLAKIIGDDTVQDVYMAFLPYTFPNLDNFHTPSSSIPACVAVLFEAKSSALNSFKRVSYNGQSVWITNHLARHFGDVRIHEVFIPSRLPASDVLKPLIYMIPNELFIKVEVRSQLRLNLWALRSSVAGQQPLEKLTLLDRPPEHDMAPPGSWFFTSTHCVVDIYPHILGHESNSIDDHTFVITGSELWNHSGISSRPLCFEAWDSRSGASLLVWFSKQQTEQPDTPNSEQYIRYDIRCGGSRVIPPTGELQDFFFPESTVETGKFW